MKELGIKHYFTLPSMINKAFAAERRVKYLRLLLARMIRSGRKVDLYGLARRAETFTNTHHKNTATGLTPNETTNDKAGYILEKLHKSRAEQTAVTRRKLVAKNPFRLGQIVAKKLPVSRVQGGAFTKTGDSQIDGNQNYMVVGVKHTAPRASYRLRGLRDGITSKGAFAPSQLQSITNAPTMHSLSMASAATVSEGGRSRAYGSSNEVAGSLPSSTTISKPPDNQSLPMTRSRALFSRLPIRQSSNSPWKRDFY